MGTRPGDLDDDGDLDAFITNSEGADFVYKNSGDATFTQHQVLNLFVEQPTDPYELVNKVD
ncbi:MAG: hypothetical protein R3C11_11160 [Planctomycetaceae bacterium]